MKAIKRARCPVCNSKRDTSDPKAQMLCPKDSTPMILSDSWYAVGEYKGQRIFEPTGPLKKKCDQWIAQFTLDVAANRPIAGEEQDISWAEAVKNCNGVDEIEMVAGKKIVKHTEDGWWDKAVENKRLSTKTRTSYRDQVAVLNKYFEGQSLLTITRVKAENFKDELSKTHAPASVAYALKTLKRIYNLHLEKLDLEETPRPKLVEKAYIINKIALPIIDNVVEASCDEDDMQKVLGLIAESRTKKLDKQRLRLAIMMGFGLLMRPVNICALRWADIDFENGTYRIDKIMMKGKKDSNHALPVQILTELKAWRLQTGLTSKFVFPSPKSVDVPMKSMAKAIRRWIQVAGLNPDGIDRKHKVTPYVLTRHTGATELYEESGENLEMVSKTADHADSKITRKRYVKDRTAYQKRTVVPIQEAMIRRMTGT